MSNNTTKPTLSIPVVNGCTPLNAVELSDPELNRIKQPHRFKAGNKCAVGHKRGKQKLTTAFVDDLSYEWSTRGQDALRELSGDKLVQACIAILPKDVLVSLNQADKVQWVINAAPALSTDDWLEQHNLIEHNQEDTFDKD